MALVTAVTGVAHAHHRRPHCPGRPFARRLGRDGHGRRSGIGFAQPMASAHGDGPSCAICADTLQLPLSASCGHQFCRACLARWLVEKPSCPLCMARVELVTCQQDQAVSLDVLLSEGRAQADRDATGETGAQPVDLMGLDHAFFGQEIARLQEAVDEQIARMAASRTRTRFGSGLTGWQRRNRDAYHAIAQELCRTGELMAGRLEQFNPNAVLERLYALQDQIQRMRADPIGWAGEPDGRDDSADAEPVLLGADDWEQGDGFDDEYDDCDDECYDDEFE